MKEQKGPACPGCSRHCTADAVRCKHGRAYFAKCRNACPEAGCGPKKYKHKWERYAREGGTAWHLLTLSRRIKKALRRGDVSDAQLMHVLSEEERMQLNGILQKLGECL